MSEFAREYADHIKQRREQESENQVFLQREKLKNERGPFLWDELRAELRSKCEEINREIHEEFFQFGQTDSGHFQVVAFSPVRTLNVVYGKKPHQIDFDYENGAGEYAVDIDENGAAFLTMVSPNRLVKYTIESVAQVILDCFAGRQVWDDPHAR
jgi:hypothetical protein